MDYTTQMNAARQGIITNEMKKVSEYENINIDELVSLVAQGKVCIPANKNHKSLKPYEDKINTFIRFLCNLPRFLYI